MTDVDGTRRQVTDVDGTLVMTGTDRLGGGTDTPLTHLWYHNGQKEDKEYWGFKQVEVSMMNGMIGWLRRSCRRVSV